MLTNRIENPVLRSAAEWAVSILLAFLLFLFIRNFVFRVADVDGHSMAPTLSHGDYVLLSRVGFWFGGEPGPGDIVAFAFQGSRDAYFIKRIIAGPHDVVDFQNGAFLVNNKPLDLTFDVEFIASGGDMQYPFTLEEGHFFVLGDNRNASKDSRYSLVGAVPRSEMLGRVVIRFWPPSQFGLVRP